MPIETPTNGRGVVQQNDSLADGERGRVGHRAADRCHRQHDGHCDGLREQRDVWTPLLKRGCGKMDEQGVLREG